MGRHADLLARHRSVMPDWLSLYYEQPIALVRGEGRQVWDAEGNRYLDFFGGILTTSSGHAVAEVVEAIQSQAARLLHTSTVYLIEPMIELAETIADLAPMPDAKVFFVPSGTEANEAALLMAASARRSNQVLALRNSYHGRSFAAVGVTGNRSWSPSAFTPLNVNYLPNGDHAGSPWHRLSVAEYIQACVEDLRQLIDTQTAGDVACLIAEPIQGVGGFTIPVDGYFHAIKQILDSHGILFVSDEVQTGWGRTGDHYWGIEAHDVVPDLLTFAKGLGNGLSIAGVVGRGDLIDSVPANSISTFGGNPLAAAGALANLEYLAKHDCQNNARVVGKQLLDGLRSRCADVDAVSDVRGKGLMIGVECRRDGQPSVADAQQIMEDCRRDGLLIGRGGLYGNVLRIAPPLTVTPEEADEALEILGAALHPA
jgi:4-aminobutyrate aminotransferase